MSVYTSRACGGLLLGLLLWCGSMSAQSATADAGQSSSTVQNVVLTVRISDKQSGLSLDAKRSIPKGSNAFAVLQEIVGVKYKTHPEFGAFVTSLCGVAASERMVWTFNVDSKWSEIGIDRVTLEKDTVIEWITR